MCAEGARDKSEKTGSTDFGCKPEDFQKLFEMMGKCCPGMGDIPDCSAMMKEMMGAMKDKGRRMQATEKTGTGCAT